MKMSKLFFPVFLLGIMAFVVNWAVSSDEMPERERNSKFDHRIDNIGYWVKMAKAGYTPFNPDIRFAPAVYTGSKINAFSVLTTDSPDVPVAGTNSTQSENSIFIDPNDNTILLNSNNSTSNPYTTLYGANSLFSFNAAETWEGEVEGAGEDNRGDPTTAIGLNGRWYINYIDNSGGQGISYSDDQGQTWATRTVAPNPETLADKNHMWIDNSPNSPYEGNLYVAWTNFGGIDEYQISVSVSEDSGETWSDNVPISYAANGSFNQGVNIQTGPNGEVYAVWAIYIGNTESAIGMAKSLDGGKTWEPAYKIIENIKGIKGTGISKNQRVNSFPVCAVDNSNGNNRGSIYVTWTNNGVPGVNTGDDIDIYLIKSVDEGATWSEPIRVNQDEAGLGHEHYFPWITVDSQNGIVSLVFYDDRNVNETDCEVFCANSDDGGQTWEDFKVSDVSFTVAPLPGSAGDYMGDYLGISAKQGWVYPVWTDNRSGTLMAYCSPYQTKTLNRPLDLQGSVTFETGNVYLNWSYIESDNFLNFNIYRNEILVGAALDTIYTDLLPAYGPYTYKVTAQYSGDLESSAAKTNVQWGYPQISATPLSIYQHLTIDSSAVQYITIVNTGQLDLIYNVSPFLEDASRNDREYCTASSSKIDEYISRVTVGEIDNESLGSLYSDFTNLSTSMETGKSYNLIVKNGNPYKEDVVAAWIDWDINGIFDDGIINFSGMNDDSTYTATISPPFSSISGETRMRVRLGYNQSLVPCGTTTYGEVEDYTVNTLAWFAIEPTAGIILPGDTSLIKVTFDANKIEPGLYNAAAIFSSNDTAVNDISVALELEVSQFSVVASTLDNINGTCIGGSIQLIATPYGNFSQANYTWHTADPDGWESEQQNPVITPSEPAWYFVVLESGGASTSDSIFINVFPIPSVNLWADTIVCQTGVFTLDAGNPGSTYLWSTGATTQVISINSADFPIGNQTFSVEVITANKCSNSDSKLVEIRDCTAIDELGDDSGFEIYPNPSKGIFTVSMLSESIKNADIRIINASGIVVYEQKGIIVESTFATKINLSSQAEGIYYIELTDGKKHFIKKLLIKN